MASPPDDSIDGFAAPAAPAVEPVAATAGTVPVPAPGPIVAAVPAAGELGPEPAPPATFASPLRTNIALGVAELGQDFPDVLQASDQPPGGVVTPAAPAVNPLAAAVAAVPAPAAVPALPVAATDGHPAEPTPIATTRSLPAPLAAPPLTDPLATLELGEDLASVLQTIDQPIERTARELVVLELYRQGRLSGDKAAEILGVSKTDFIKHVSDLGMNEDTSAACLSGLTSVLETVREDLRSIRLLFASNLILAFSIPIATLATSNRDVFLVDRLTIRFFTFSKILAWDFAQLVFCTWILAILVFGFGIVRLLLGKNESERVAESEVKAAIQALAENHIAVAVRRLSTAVDFYIKSVGETLKARWPFLITFAFLVVCIGVEFALYLFSPLPKQS
jgi:hypothetical protein